MMDKQQCFKCGKVKDKELFPILDQLEIRSMICCECREGYNSEEEER